VLALEALLRPLHWAHKMIPIVSPSLLDVVESPMPILAGVQHLPGGYVQEADTLIVWLDRATIDVPVKEQLIEGETITGAAYLEMLLPDSSALCYKLRRHMTSLFRVNGSVKNFDTGESIFKPVFTTDKT